MAAPADGVQQRTYSSRLSQRAGHRALHPHDLRAPRHRTRDQRKNLRDSYITHKF